MSEPELRSLLASKQADKLAISDALIDAMDNGEDNLVDLQALKQQRFVFTLVTAV